MKSAGQNDTALADLTRFRRRNCRTLDSLAAPSTMEEKRKHQRTEINEPAYVSANGSVMGCIVRNISQEGASIEVENPAFVPAQFRLVMASDSSSRECTVIWIQQKRIGVAFAIPAVST